MTHTVYAFGDTPDRPLIKKAVVTNDEETAHAIEVAWSLAGYHVQVIDGVN